MCCLRLLFPMMFTLAAIAICLPAIADTAADATERARKFVAAHESKVRPLDIALGTAWWNANTTGKEEDYKIKEQAQNRMDEVLSDPVAFKEVKAIKEAGGIQDKVIARAIDVIYLTLLEKQVDRDLLKDISATSNRVEKAFNNYRAAVDGKEMTDSEVRKVLKESKNSDRRKAVWEASKGVGSVVEADLKKLVKLRNEAAKKLGFKNFHAMQLYLNEQDGDALLKLFDDLDTLTREPYLAAKRELDQKLAADCSVSVDELRPWHYHDPFFQDSPKVFAADLDEPYAKVDLMKWTSAFYQSIGLPVDDVIARSDLYERKGKCPHAFCTDINREGDVRVLANVVPNQYWMNTCLHEFGHSVYSSKNIPHSLPYVLRGESHILTTEGVAMMFERLSLKRAWIEKMGGKVTDAKTFDESAAKALRCDLLIFSRWCQVMLRFEKSMYENPDQDLSKLWWDLVEKYQALKRPDGRKAPDYASKIHIVTSPVYYHNYMMGELFASQVHHAIAREVYKGADPTTVIYMDNKAVGDFMKKRVFEPGRTLAWNALTKFATGEELNPKDFAEDFKAK